MSERLSLSTFQDFKHVYWIWLMNYIPLKVLLMIDFKLCILIKRKQHATRYPCPCPLEKDYVNGLDVACR